MFFFSSDPVYQSFPKYPIKSVEIAGNYHALYHYIRVTEGIHKSALSHRIILRFIRPWNKTRRNNCEPSKIVPTNFYSTLISELLKLLSKIFEVAVEKNEGNKYTKTGTLFPSLCLSVVSLSHLEVYARHWSPKPYKTNKILYMYHHLNIFQSDVNQTTRKRNYIQMKMESLRSMLLYFHSSFSDVVFIDIYIWRDQSWEAEHETKKKVNAWLYFQNLYLHIIYIFIFALV